MGFQQGLSGLKASSTSLDVIGNNIANASTVGYKRGQAQFSDIYASSMHTAAANQVGIGVSVMRVQQQFTQGNVTPSANALDIAINGNGFFRFQDEAGSIFYSRNGQLELTKEGYLVNGAGHRLTGYLANEAGQVLPGAPQLITLSTEYIDPKVTSKVTSLLNLDSREAPATVAPFDPQNPLSFNHATGIDVYDSLGNMHVLEMYYVKTGPEVGGAGNGTWDVYICADGQIVNTAVPPLVYPAAGAEPTAPAVPTVVAEPDVADYGNDPTDPDYVDALDAYNAYLAAQADYDNNLKPAYDIAKAAWDAEVARAGKGTPLGTLTFDAYGKAIGTQTFPGLVIPGINGAADTNPPIDMDFSGTTQYGSNFAVNDNQQDGYASGRLTGFAVDDFGNIQGRYSNGESKILAQLCLAAFRNPNGLGAVGDNEWVETMESGAPIEGAALSGQLGSVNDYSVEESGVDLTEELVDMIVAQRVYQANAQTIKTEDQIMQTLVNLR